MLNTITKSKDYVQLLFDTVSDAVIATNNKYEIEYWNKGAEKIYGYTADEMLGKVMPEVIPTKYIGTTREEIIEEFLKNEFWQGEVIHTAKDGKELNIEASSAVIKNEDGSMKGVVAVNRNITERKKWEEAQIVLAKLDNGRTLNFLERAKVVNEDNIQLSEGVRYLYSSVITDIPTATSNQMDCTYKIRDAIQNIIENSKEIRSILGLGEKQKDEAE